MGILNNKTNRNRRYRLTFSGSTGYASENGETIPESFVTQSVDDNFYISKPIPASDHQYWWITSSLVVDDRVYFPIGYATSSTDISFVTSSEFNKYAPPTRTTGYITTVSPFLVSGEMSYGAKLVEVDLDTYRVYLNPSSDIENTGEAQRQMRAYIASIMTPYGYPSWRQVRTGDQLVARALRKTSNLVLEDPPQVLYNGNKQIKARRSQTQTKYDIPYISSRFRKIVHGVEEIEKYEIANKIVPKYVEYDFGSLLSYFPLEEIDRRLQITERESVVYNSIYKKYNLNLESNIGDFLGIRYSEVIWPRERNAYLSTNRDRTLFSFNWRDKRSDRTQNDATNSLGLTMATSSIWPLDARQGPYRTESLFTTASTSHHGDVGELQTVSSIYHNGTESILTASALFSYPVPDSSSAGVFYTNDTIFNMS